MRIPIARQRPFKTVSDIMYFEGLNNTSDFKDQELKSMKNLSSDEFPLICTRSPRKVIKTLTNPKYLFASDKLCYVDGLDFYYDDVKKGTLTKDPTSIVEFNKYILIFPEKAYYDITNDEWGTFTSPDIDYVTVSNNRVFGVKGTEIFASKLGDFKTWDSFQGLSTDSYAADVPTGGNFNGIINYANHVTMTKPDVLHEMYGNKPENYTIPEAFKSGSLGNKSLVELKGILYFVGTDGVKNYNGGIPRTISDKINKKYASAVAGTDLHKYYVSIFDGVKHELFVYTPKYNMWHKEDDLEVINFAYYDGSLLALCKDGNIYKFGSGSEVIEWEFETQVFDEKLVNNKNYKTIYLNIDLEEGSEITVFVKRNNEDYEMVRTITSYGFRSYKIPINVQKTHHFQIKVSGKGKAKVHSITREFIVGGDV